MDIKKENKILTSDRKDNLSMHQKFDKLIDEYYSDLKDEKKTEKLEKHPQTCDHIFKSVNRDKTDYARIDENDEPPIFTDLVENEAKIGTLKINNPLPKIEKRDELKKSYMKWLKTEKLMRPEERRLEYENMQKKYLETLKLTQDIKKDVKLARVIKSHYPRGIVGVDSIYNEKTLLYKDQYNEIKNKQEAKEKRLKERGEVLEKYNNKNGNFLAFETDN
ncbi:conserved Plasmodium protein, unknown function [Plasmodium gallinaceum]|uniref:Uncharacterized protein n=1 Tax=Plasmodium gallinaceum TaxID=5849 RepID=A0A1J1H0I9_PLAGA|nr:conserved Plasmodium protein, unknown function [Plasmodium gallinaceum]CRG96797.1 conserved Plasmodium protein, unknown function [Plasmodium gallinaceum]